MSAPASLASSIADLLIHLDRQNHRPETYDRKTPHDSTPLASQSSLHLHGSNQTEAAKPVAKTTTQNSRSSSSEHKVPRAQRRGPLAFLTVIPEYDDARNYSSGVKLWIVLIVAFAGTTGPMGTSIMLPAIDEMARDLSTSVSTVNVSVGVYLILLGVFPMWWSNFSERHGRRVVYVASYAWFLAFLIGLALAPTILSLVVMRLLAGVGASAVQACGAATVADLYVMEERGTALGLFYLGPLLGPFLSPIVGGAVAEAWGWRATMWVMVIVCGCNVVLLFFFLPETLRRDDLMAQVRRRLKEQIQRGEIDVGGLREDQRENQRGEKDAENAVETVELGLGGATSGSLHRGSFSQKSSQDQNNRTTNTITNNKTANDSSKVDDVANTEKAEAHPDKNISALPDAIGTVGGCPMDLVGALERSSLESSVESRLNRIISNLSHNSSLRRQVLSDETPVDLLTPSLLRINTNRSAYSRRIQEIEMTRAELDDSVEPQGWSHHVYDYIVRPAHAVLLLGYPPVALAIFFSAVSFMGIYLFNISITNCYSADPYNYSSVIVGLMYIPNSVTYIVASILGGRWNDWLIRRCAARNHGDMIPESRILWNIVLAVSLYPPACLIFGWCIDKGEFWLVPLIGTALFGFSSMLVIGVTLTYIIDVLPGKGATGVALNNLVRQILAAIATFVTAPLIRALTVGVLFSIYAGILMVCSLCLWYLKRRGGTLRERFDIVEYYARL